MSMRGMLVDFARKLGNLVPQTVKTGSIKGSNIALGLVCFVELDLLPESVVVVDASCFASWASPTLAAIAIAIAGGLSGGAI